MANGSIPHVGSRVSVQLFARDVLAHQQQISWDSYSTGNGSLVVSDGAGVRVVLTGDRTSVRMVLAAALAQLGPEVDDQPSGRRPDTYLDGIDHDRGIGG